MNFTQRISFSLLLVALSASASALKVAPLAKLSATSPPVGTVYGAAVAIDGDTVVVGDSSYIGLGCAYVYVKPASGWQDMTESAQLLPSDAGVVTNFAAAVAIRGDVIAVSDYGHNQNHGIVYVYVKPAGGWSGVLTETAQLSASDDDYGFLLGRVLAMDSEGTIYAGAPLKPGRNGSIYVFAPSGGGWKTGTQTAELTSTHGLGAGIGDQVLTADGSTVVAGGAGWPNGYTGPDYGAAYVWVKPATGWVSTSHETALLTLSDPQVQEELADSAALYGDTLILGAPGLNGFAGGAYAYTKPSTGWANTSTYTAKFTAKNLQVHYSLGASAATTSSFVLLGLGGYGHILDEGALDFYAPPPFGGTVLEPAVLIPDPLHQRLASFGQIVAAQGNVAVASAYDEYPVGGVYLFGVE